MQALRVEDEMIFGERPIEPKELVEDLVFGVVNRTAPREVRTSAIKSALGEIASVRNFYSAPDPKKSQHEYLLDFLWFENSRSNNIVLGVESELSKRKEDVWEDFDKLMHIKAPMKLMIWKSINHEKQAPEVLEGLRTSYLKNFNQHVKGELYVVLEFSSSKAAYWYLYEVPNDGEVVAPDFHAMGAIPYSDLDASSAAATPAGSH